ncbi:MAG: MupG family TIM beta-alpha barrel fold protein [Oscillospiraceae bacterium]|nr:MupG family TIM beta-alpha barrel fold protein [Oscillospiraceae bacterium]
MKTGFSYYFGTNPEQNQTIFQKAICAGMEYVFTSLHIPEEQVDDYAQKVRTFIADCQAANLNCMVDVSPHTLEKLGCDGYEDLKAMGVEYLRLDFGFSHEEIVSLSNEFYVVFNASTMSRRDVETWQALGADFTRFVASHNFYPKPLTGLSLERVAESNRYFKSLGFTTMSFVAGDRVYRGPLFQGLPTVEDHRDTHVLRNMLQLFHETQSDVVLIGDVDVSDETWQQICALNQGFVTLRADVEASFSYVKESLHHDRPDSSPYVLRSVESRQVPRKVPQATPQLRPKGAICVGNEAYLRYEGELEIARVDLPIEERVNVVGQIHPEDLQYLAYIKDGFGFVLQ